MWRATLRTVLSPRVPSRRTAGPLLAALVVGCLPLASVAACAGDGASPPAEARDVGPSEPPRPDGPGVGPVTDAATSTPDGGPSDARADVVEAGPKPPFACQADPNFPSVLAVPEASGAAEVELTPGVRELLVVSDSGRGGVGILIALGAGGGTRAITLPLDQPAIDDNEGIAWRGGALYALTSSGAVRRFVPDGQGGLARDQDVYRLGAAPASCADLAAVNCGRNYEGLCLRSAPSASPCAGYAASKAEGKLYCVGIDAAERLFARTDVPPISLSFPADQLSDCAFGAAGGPAADVLVVTTNVFGLSRSYRVDEATGATTRLPSSSLLNVEAAAIDKDGALYVFDDNSSSQSTASKTSCVGW